jgi:hypothetical protein
MDVYVIYHVPCVDIYVISLFVLMESKKTKKIAGKQRPNFLVLSSARAMALGKDFFKKFFLPSARAAALGKVFLKKNKKNFFTECKTMALGKDFFLKKRFFFVECR